MKTFVIVLLGVATASAIPLNRSVYGEETSEDGWFVPQIDGSFKWVTEEEANRESRKLSMQQFRSSVEVDFYLYTRSNPTTPQQISVSSQETLTSSSFNKDHPTIIIIHGWRNNYLSGVNENIRSALLDVGEFNVICVDWSDKAETINYISAKDSVPEVAKEVAALIDFLSSIGALSFDNLKVIGHSLGAHVSGFAGKYVTQGKIHTIIGLDPAYPLYHYGNCDKRLCETDAFYVESIQTDGGLLGFLKPIGKAAFYPNGGRLQPGCHSDLTTKCSHEKSYIYYAEAIRTNVFLSVQCADYETAVDKDCGSTYSANLKLGAPTNDVLADGIYFTPVNEEAPYGMG